MLQLPLDVFLYFGYIVIHSTQYYTRIHMLFRWNVCIYILDVVRLNNHLVGPKNIVKRCLEICQWYTSGARCPPPSHQNINGATSQSKTTGGQGRVEWFSTFCYFRKGTHAWRSGIFLRDQYQKIGKFGRACDKVLIFKKS